MSSLKTSSRNLCNGFYAFSTNQNEECVNMIYNPGIKGGEGRTTFNKEEDKKISGEEMITTFTTLKNYCIEQIDIPDFEEYTFEELDQKMWEPGPLNYNTIDCALYVISDEIITSIYGKLHDYANLLSYLKENMGEPDYTLITDINGHNIEKESIYYIDRVDSHPTKGRGKKLCKPSLYFFLSYLINKSINLLFIHNASYNSIAACYCYLRAGEDANLKIYNHDGVIITSSECPAHIENGKQYYYVKRGIFEGGDRKRKGKTKLKRITKRKKANRKRKTKRKIKSKKSRKARNLRT